MIIALDKEFFLSEENLWQTWQQTPIIEKPHTLATFSFYKEFFLKYWKTVEKKMSLGYFPVYLCPLAGPKWEPTVSLVTQ